MSNLGFDVPGDHAIPVGLLGSSSMTVAVLSGGGTVYYAAGSQVSVASNEGSIAAGASAVLTEGVWLISASRSTVRVTFATSADVSSDGTGLPASVLTVSSPTRFNTPTSCLTIQGNGATDTASTQSTFITWASNITNPDANVRPVAVYQHFHVAPTGGAPAVDTDFHGLDFVVSSDTTANNNGHLRIYALEASAVNNGNARTADLVSIYGLVDVGSGGASGGTTGVSRSIQAGINLANGCSVGEWAAFFVRQAAGSGTIGTAFGLYVPSWTGLGTTVTVPYAVYVEQGGGPIYTNEPINISAATGRSSTGSPLTLTGDSTIATALVSVTQAGAGQGVQINQSGANSALGIVQTGAALGVAINSNAVGAAGFFAENVNGYDYGTSISTNQDGGQTLLVTKNGTGAGAVLTINNKGSSAALLVQQSGTTKFQILNSGWFKTASTAESTGAGSAALGANCPAVTATAPYKWIAMATSDGSTVYFPVWK